MQDKESFLPEVIVVMPVFNEQASVRKVVTEWFREIENWTEEFTFLAIDDGSNDGTLQILQGLKERLGTRLEILSRENRGHGQSCLEGYRIACERGIPYLFQIDSDGQCDPQYFFRFWRDRAKFDVIYGYRRVRDDGWRRVLASFILRATLLIFAGTNCVDANVPYRLMRTSALGNCLNLIPGDFFLTNVALAVMLKRGGGLRHGQVSIRFRERYGGEPSVRLGMFGDKAMELILQLKNLPPKCRQ